MKLKSLFSLILAAQLFAACGDITGSSEKDDVRASAETSALELTNSRSAAIYYFIVDREVAATILWAPCTDPDSCPSVAAGKTTRISSEQIYEWGRSGEVIVYWWHLVPKAGGGHQPDQVRSLIVKTMKLEIRDYVLLVAPHQIDCVGVAPMRCMLVREDPNAQWLYFYDSIEGFTYEPGFNYRLRIRRTPVPNPPADGSSFRFQLLELLEKSPATP